MKNKPTNRKDPRLLQQSTLSEEDLALWNNFKRNIKPLSERERNRAINTDEKIIVSGTKQPWPEYYLATNPPVLKNRDYDKKKRTDASPTQFDRKRVRHIQTGKIALQARLDLHGMRQDQAYVSLRNFLRQCQSEGLKTVLVITGKGKIDGAEQGNLTDDRDRGILRRVIPEWLSLPEFRDLTLGYNVASARHGGSGAIYVNIRRAK